MVHMGLTNGNKRHKWQYDGDIQAVGIIKKRGSNVKIEKGNLTARSSGL
jgi:hypothetical protein